MLKLTRTYTDYNGISRTEDFYFSLTQAEIMEMELSVDGGLIDMINRIVAAKDGKQIINLFKDLVLRSYGEKSQDGRRFIKTQEVRDAFEQTPVYSDIFMELATNAKAASDFVIGIIPAHVAEKLEAAQADEQKETEQQKSNQPQLLDRSSSSNG